MTVVLCGAKEREIGGVAVVRCEGEREIGGILQVVRRRERALAVVLWWSGKGGPMNGVLKIGRVATTSWFSCGSMFKAPKTMAQVLQHYPGYGIFRKGYASEPLPEQERLSYGLFYYLLSLKDEQKRCCDKVGVEEGVRGLRMKLVIEQRQLEEILSEQVNIEALIEKMRMAATGCSTTSPSRSPTLGS
ncbi:hypothetical protein LR48_Vigan04g020100 [Vigna angularis]|uniref:Uncharacterized protein n=1 Tax=Phaseolus angularis TaxID=3914 RepID=A0A0L9UB88_PHAAN|nr:hypothetical protein LR48_Vigan04g020100 [Vigna angularis]